MNPAVRTIGTILAGGMLACLTVQAQEHVPGYAVSAGGNGLNTVRCLEPGREGTVFLAGECVYPLQWENEVYVSSHKHGGFVSMLEADGRLRWLVRLESPSYFTLTTLTVTGNNHLLLGGTSLDTVYYPGGSIEAEPPMSSFLLEMDTLGNMIRALSLFPAHEGYLHSMAEIPGNRYVVCGDYQGNTPVKGMGKKDIFLACLRKEGETDWIRSIGSRKIDQPAGLVYNGKDIYLGGNFSHRLRIGDTTLLPAGREDFFIARYDTDGHLISLLHQGGAGSDILLDFEVDSCGNVWCTGYNEYYSPGEGIQGGKEFFLIGFDSTGSPGTSFRPEGPFDESGLFLEREYPSTLYFLMTSEGPVPGIDGEAGPPGQIKNTCLGKLSQKDSPEWIRLLGILPGAEIHVMKSGTDGDVFVGGNFCDSGIIGDMHLKAAGQKDLLVARYYDPCRRVRLDMGPDRYLCPGQTDTLKVTGNWAAYNWNNGEGNESYFPVDKAGRYTLETVTEHGCRYIDTVGVFESALSATPELWPEQIPPGNNGSIFLNITGNYPPFDCQSALGGNGPLYSGLCQGCYSFTVTDSVGCSTDIQAELESEIVYGLGLKVDPNPYAILTNVTYTIPEKGPVELLLFSQSGNLQKILFRGVREPGTYLIELSGTDLTPGIYVLHLKTGKQALSRKILVTGN